MIGSLCSLPRIRAAANPAPNSTPLTAGIEKSRWAHRAFDRVEERFAQRGRYAGRGAFDDASDRVLSPQRLLDDFREVVRIVTIVDLDRSRLSILTLRPRIFLATTPAATSPSVQPSREVSAAPVVVEAAELAGGDPVGVRGAGMGDEVGIVAREGVLVAEQNGQRRSGRPALEQAGSDFRKVAFLAGRRTPLGRFCGGSGPFRTISRRARCRPGTPSSVTPTSGPCDSPKIETLNSLPKLFIWLSFRCGRVRPDGAARSDRPRIRGTTWRRLPLRRS